MFLNRKIYSKVLFLTFIVIFLLSAYLPNFLSVIPLSFAETTIDNNTYTLDTKSHWLENDYDYRKQIMLKNNSGQEFTASTTIAITINTKELVDTGKLQVDCNDLRIAYDNGSSQTELSRAIVYEHGTDNCADSTTTQVYFPLQTNMSSGANSSSYYYYYGNPLATSPPSPIKAFDIGNNEALFVCPLNGTVTCIAGESSVSVSSGLRYSGGKSAIHFNGLLDEPSSLTGPILPSVSVYTIEGYFKQENPQINTYAGIYTGWGGFDNNDINTIQNEGQLIIGLPGNLLSTTDFGFNDGHWHHLAFVYDGSTFSVYADGINVGSKTVSLTIAPKSFKLGLRSGNYRGWKGTIDEFRISNIVRYNSDFTPPTTPFKPDSNTLVLYHFDENGDDPRNTGKAFDASDNNNYGILANGLTYVSGLVGIDNGTSDTGKSPFQSYASHQGLFLEEATTNQIYNPSAENDTVSWGCYDNAVNCTFSRITSDSKFGSAAFRIQSSSSNVTIRHRGRANISEYGLAEGDKYCYSSYIKTSSGTSKIFIAWIAGSSLISSDTSPEIASLSWTRAKVCGTVPVGATNADVKIFANGTGADIYIDGIQFEVNKTSPTTYTDGSLGSGYSWNGTVHNSTSKRAISELRYNSVNKINSEKGSISFWVKPDWSPAEARHSLMTINGYYSGLSLAQHTNGGGILYTVVAGSIISSKSIADWNKDKWHFVTITWDNTSSTVNTYVDNDAAVSGTYSTPANFSNFIGLGTESQVYPTGNAAFSDFRIYDQPLSSIEISDLYYAGLTTHQEGNELEIYNTTKMVESSTIDANIPSNWENLFWNQTIPNGVGPDAVRFRFAVKDSDSGWVDSDFVGSDCTSSSYFSDSSSPYTIDLSLCFGNSSKRYARYRVYLQTDDQTVTPSVGSVEVEYNQASPTKPSSFSGTGSGSDRITWSWQDTSSNENGFYVKDENGNIKCTVFSANTTSCTEKGLSQNMSYTRYVVSFNNVGESTPSSHATVSTTALLVPHLHSPDNNTYTNNEHPSFKFKPPIDSSGITFYKLMVKDINETIFTVSDIPISRISDYDQPTYKAIYEGFDDNDNSNNSITINTKSSSNWKSDGNDGKLREGKNTWTIISVDEGGNESGNTRSIYLDRVVPTLTLTQLNEIILKDYGNSEALVVNTFDMTPTIFGTIYDNFVPEKVEFAFYKQHLSFGIVTSQSLVTLQTYDLHNTDENPQVSFGFTPADPLEYGRYAVEITGVDKAGNKSHETVVYLNIGPLTGTRLDKNQSVDNEERIIKNNNKISLPDLEKNAKIRRAKEAIELQKFTEESNNFFSEMLYGLTATTQFITSQLGKGVVVTVGLISDSTSFIANGLTDTKTTLYAAVNKTMTLAGKAIVSSYVNTAQQVPQTFGNIMLSLGEVSKTASDSFTETENSVKEQIAISSENTTQQIGKIYQFIQNTNIALIISQDRARDTIVKSHQNTSEQVAKTGKAFDVLARSIKKPIDDTSGFLYRVKVGVSTFYAIVFDPNPTYISDVTIEELGRDYAIISWKTNHYAWGKINYGEDLTYGKEVVVLDRKKEHIVRLTGLEPDKRYFFEVMSQSKNYTYDAYYSFETKK